MKVFSRMNILKLSTNAGGGATVAAERQARALRHLGHTVKHLHVRQDWTCNGVKLQEDSNNIYISAPMPRFLKTDLMFQSYIADNRTTISNTYMSLWRKTTPFDQKLLEYILVQGFDIVHCHWTSNLISSKLMKSLKANNVKIVITGHDMNHFTGACHYDAGCGGFRNGCKTCCQLISDDGAIITASMKEKLDCYINVKPHFIFPCNWLNEEYKASSIGCSLGCNSSSVLRNCIDTDFFSPAKNKEMLLRRQEFGFAEDEILIVSGAENNHEVRKGFRYFEHAFKALNRSLYGSQFNKKITFVAFGGGNHVLAPTHPQVRYRHLGVLKEVQVRDLFRVADLLAFTSVEENFANVILESLMCACPVLGFNIGGIPDIVKPGINGELVGDVSEFAFSEAMINLITKRNLSQLQSSTKAWREASHSHYGYEYIANQLVTLYSDVLQGELNG